MATGWLQVAQGGHFRVPGRSKTQETVTFLEQEPEQGEALLAWAPLPGRAWSNPCANSEHFVGGGTGLMVWVGAAVPTGEMRC